VRVVACLASVSFAVLALGAPASAEDWTWRGEPSEALDLQAFGPVATSFDLGQPLLAGAAADVATADGLYRIQSSETWLAQDGALDRLRITTAAFAPGAYGLLRPDDGRLTGGGEAVDVTYTRALPRALSGRSGRYAFEVTPHAGIGVGDFGNSAEAGATLRIAEGDDPLERLAPDGKKFGDEGRWYLFAATSGRALGYNFLKREDGWKRSGMSTDAGAFVGDTQAGVAWRKGAMQASFGWVHREVKARGVRAFDTSRDEQLVAFTLSIKPRR
jgi:hypothetical protein